MTTVRIVLADDHPVVREGLKLLLGAQPDMEVVGEAADGATACELVATLVPDVLLIDFSLPVIDGAEVTRRVLAGGSHTKVLPLTVHEERIYVEQLLRAGASGYVLKRTAATEIVTAVRVVAGGGTYLDPAIAGGLVRDFITAEHAAGAPRGEALSAREREVVLRTAQGFSNKEIATELDISVKTVETYKARAAEKLELRTRVDLVRYAVAQGWLTEGATAEAERG